MAGEHQAAEAGLELMPVNMGQQAVQLVVAVEGLRPVVAPEFLRLEVALQTVGGLKEVDPEAAVIPGS